MPVIAVPIAVGVANAGVWAYRAYQVYRAARAAQAVLSAARALEEMEAAQAAAKPDDKAEEKTESQAKADATTSADCKNCNEDPDCQTARDKLKDALQGTKGEDANNRGLAERLCHWLHGTDEGQRASHIPAIQQSAARVQKAMDWLTGKGDRPYGKKEGATLSKEAKNKKLKDCSVPADLKKDTDDLLKYAKEVADGKTSVSPVPMANFAAECTKAAFSMVMKAFGK